MSRVDPLHLRKPITASTNGIRRARRKDSHATFSTSSLTALANTPSLFVRHRRLQGSRGCAMIDVLCLLMAATRLVRSGRKPVKSTIPALGLTTSCAKIFLP